MRQIPTRIRDFCPCRQARWDGNQPHHRPHHLGASDLQLGDHSVTVEASDGRGGRDEQTFVVRVMPVPGNHPPVIVSEPITTGIAGGTYSYLVEAVDADRDPLTYALVSGPDGMTIVSESGLVSWASSVGVFPVTLRVSDRRGGADLQTFTLKVADIGTGENQRDEVQRSRW